jgi:hypothetical protein
MTDRMGIPGFTAKRAAGRRPIVSARFGSRRSFALFRYLLLERILLL